MHWVFGHPPHSTSNSRPRRWSRNALGTIVAAACALLATPSATAELGARLEYVAPPGCPDRADFERRVRERLLSESIELKSLEQLVVRVSVEPQKQRASVELQGSDGGRVERAVQGRTCEELVSGVALITALAFGAHTQAKAETEAAAPEAKPEEPAPGAAEAPKPPEVTAAKAPVDAAAGTRSSKLVPLKPPPKSAPRVVPKSQLPSKSAGDGSEDVPEDSGPESIGEARSRRGFSVEAGAGGWLSTWLAPTRMLGGDAFARIGARTGSWSARASALLGAATAEVGDRRADLDLYGGRLEGCPIGARLLSRLSAEACVAAELGALRGSGRAESALREADSQTVFWGAAVLLARARSPLGPLVIEAQAELGIPVSGNEFVFQNPEQSVFKAPDFGAAGRLGIGVPFL